MKDNSPVIFNTVPPPIPTTAYEIGVQLASDSAPNLKEAKSPKESEAVA